jgi:hypothetical protein
MDMVAQIAHRLQTILNEEAETLGKETTFLKRKRKITAPDFVQQLIFAWWQEPTITLDGLVQIGQRREVAMTASGISQRFTQESALLMARVLQRLSAEHVQADEEVPVALLRRFEGVLVEDSSVIALPVYRVPLCRYTNVRSFPGLVRFAHRTPTRIWNVYFFPTGRQSRRGAVSEANKPVYRVPLCPVCRAPKPRCYIATPCH